MLIAGLHETRHSKQVLRMAPPAWKRAAPSIVGSSSLPGSHTGDADFALDLGDARRCPGRLLRLVAFRPRPHVATKGHLAVAGFDRDAVRVELRASHESRLYLFLDVGWLNTGRNGNKVGD